MNTELHGWSVMYTPEMRWSSRSVSWFAADVNDPPWLLSEYNLAVSTEHLHEINHVSQASKQALAFVADLFSYYKAPAVSADCRDSHGQEIHVREVGSDIGRQLLSGLWQADCIGSLLNCSLEVYFFFFFFFFFFPWLHSPA